MRLKIRGIVLLCSLCMLTITGSFVVHAGIMKNTVGSDILWDRTYGGILGDYGNDIIECRDGGYAIVGGTLSAGVTNTDLLLIRTDWDGNMLWNQTIGGPNDDAGYWIIECAAGGFAMTGYSRSNPSGRSDAWLVRTAADGTHLWNQSYGGLDNDQGFAVIEVSSGGFAIVGSSRSYGSEDPVTHLATYDIWLIRTDNFGNVLWNRTYGEVGDDIGRSIQELNDGGFVISGEINSSFATLDHSGTYTEYHPDAWLLRTNSAGLLIWNQTFGGEGNDFFRSLTAEANDGFVIAGFTNSYGTGTYDGWTVTTDSDGTEVSSTTFGSISDDYLRTILQCETSGHAYIGYTYTTTSADLLITRTNSEGGVLWTRVFGGEQEDIIRSGIRSRGDFVLIGYTTSFGAGSRDVWLIKIADVPPMINPFQNALPIIVISALIVFSLIAIILILRFLRHRSNRTND